MTSRSTQHAARNTQHEKWMRLALKLARRGRGRVEPNPMVGAVLVKRGQQVGQGYHQRFGGPHAEPNALKDAGRAAKGSTVYVNLEPCAHYGKTPPCANALIAAQVAKVVTAVRDPFPATNGKGLRKLRQAGIEVVEDVLTEEAQELNAAFLKWVQTGRPLVTLKWAMTLDGKIATRTGDSKWVSCEASRRYAHKLRSYNQAILVGVGTVLQDDPLLTCRIHGARNPMRVVLDSRLRTPPDCQLIQTIDQSPVLIATTRKAPKRKRQQLERAGAEVLAVRQYRGHVDVGALLDALGERAISTLLVEGGGQVHGAFRDARLADRVVAFVAPKLVGGRDAATAIAGQGAPCIASGLELTSVHWRRLDTDLVLEATVATGP